MESTPHGQFHAGTPNMRTRAAFCEDGKLGRVDSWAIEEGIMFVLRFMCMGNKWSQQSVSQ